MTKSQTRQGWQARFGKQATVLKPLEQVKDEKLGMWKLCPRTKYLSLKQWQMQNLSHSSGHVSLNCTHFDRPVHYLAMNSPSHFTGTTDLFFLFCFKIFLKLLPKSCKICCFWPKSNILIENLFKPNWFPILFLPKCQIFFSFQNFCVCKWMIFTTRRRREKKGLDTPILTWEVCLPVKQ